VQVTGDGASGTEFAERRLVGLAHRHGTGAAGVKAASGRRPQRGLSPAGRRANVRGAFRARSEVSGRVCVVDDVYTTGATLSACGSALRRRGAGEVAALTLARAVRR